jgi:copper type II ascorbate-dependent monooxygenase-like protein
MLRAVYGSVLVSSLALTAVACFSGGPTDTSAPPDAGDAGASTSVTFHKDVEPILQQHCDMCHVQGGIAPMPLVTFRDTQPYASMVATQTSSRLMPPWGAVSTPDCTPPLSWKDDPTLTASQIATLAAWSSGGAPEGDPADAPPPLQPQPIALSGVNADLAPPASYALTETNADAFRCFVLDPKITQTTYLNGSFVVPGNREIVHHALVFADATGASRAMITDPATQSYDCFGGAGIPEPLLLAAWAPGGLPADYPSNVGAPLQANTLLVMQVHYHPHSSADSLGPDQTHFQMRLTTQRPQYLALTILPGNFDSAVGPDGDGLLPGPDDPPSGPTFVIPPNVSGHTETMQLTVPATLKGVPLPHLYVYAVGGHEHYVGTAVEVDVRHASPPQGTPQNQCLVAIPHWDFDWQRWYTYDAPIEQLPVVAPGDVMTIHCTYDNTLDNPKVVQSLEEQGLSQPQTVRLGETTLDEMCLAPTVLLARLP